MSKTALLALDLDNTLLTNAKTIAEESRHWIQRATSAGIVVVLATGRGIQNTVRYIEELELDSPMVLANGSEIWKSPGVLLERHLLSKSDVKWITNFIARNGVKFWAYGVQRFIYFEDWTPEMYEEDWLKFGISHNDTAIIEHLRKELVDTGRFQVTQSEPTNLEILSLGISKAYGVKQVCADLGLTLNQVMAVGDSANDYELIKSVGLGVAMANASTELKAVADALTDSNENNGVAKAIRRHIFNEAL